MSMNSGRILVIKLAPYDSLVSSNMRMLALMKGIDQIGYSMDLLTVPKSTILVDNDMSDYTFLERVNIVTTSQSNLYEAVVSKRHGGIVGKLYPIAKKVYHKFSLYNHTDKVAKQVSINILPRKEYDYVIAVSDPKTTYIALKTLLDQGLKAKKIVEYWGDPLYGDITQSSIFPGFVLKREERKFLAMADKVVYTSPLTLAMEKKTYPEFSGIMTCLPTANVKPRIFPDTKNKVYTVGYYGGYKSTVRNIMPLYKAFGSLTGIAKLNLVGDTDLNLMSTENIMVKPRGVVKELEEQTDLFACVLNSSGTQIPGKIYHMAASNRPILVILDGDMKESISEYLKTFNRFVMCENTEESIRNAILTIMIMKENRKWTPCEILEPKSIAAEMLS